MGLFDKKYCDICGKEIKLLGNRKLDDGNMCKNCAAKLSPFFTGRRHTSVKDIKAQLAYRADNEKLVAAFNPSKTIGKRYKVYIDEGKKQFIVTSASNWKTVNPDVISMDDIKAINVTIDEDVDEVFDKDEEGKKISFNPPKYEYEYEFEVEIKVNNPFFDEIQFDLTSDHPDSPYSDSFKAYVDMVKDLKMTLKGESFDVDYSQFKYPAQEETEESTDWFCPQCGTKNQGNFCTKCGTPKPAAFTAFFCSNCGEKIISADTKFCPKCGKALK